MGIALRRAGWRLVYDPLVAVDHFLAPRFDEDQRQGFNALATENAAFNEAFIRMEHLSRFGRFGFLLWAIAIGTRASPGIAQWLRFLPRQRSLAGCRLSAALRGRILAWNETWANERRSGSNLEPSR